MSSAKPPVILFFVEDPGAANVLVGLQDALRAQGLQPHVITDKSRVPQLERLGVRIDQVSMPNDDPGQWLQEFDPDAAVVGTSENPDSKAFALIAALRPAGRPSLAIVDGAANSAHRFRGRTDDPLSHAPDWLLVPDQSVAESFVQLGYPRGRVWIVGHPHYDYVVAQREHLSKIARDEYRNRVMPGCGGRRVVTFLTETNTGLAAEQYRRSPAYTLHGRGTQNGRTEIALEEFLDALGTLPRRPYVVLRLHPKNDPEEFSVYAFEIDQVSQAEPALEIVYASDLVVGMTTHLLLEAALLRRPTLSVLTREAERDWLPTIGLGVTPCATTREELRRQLEAWYFQKERPVVDIDQALSFGAAGRIAGILKNLVDREAKPREGGR